MMNGWRRAFCTSIPKDRDTGDDSPENHHPRCREKPSSRFGFFSNPSTPRPDSGSILRCRSWATTAVAPPSPSLPSSPKLQCRTSADAATTPKRNRSPVSLLSLSSSPSSPKSPASFSLLKSKLGFNKSSNKCGICSQSVKAGQGTAIFTAECSHAFHFPCVASRAADPNVLKACPVCGASLLSLSLSLSLHELGSENFPKSGSKSESESRTREGKNHKSLRVYNDDEPLISSPISLVGFNPIPESDENDDDEEEQDNGEFRGFFVKTPSPLTAKLLKDPASRNVDVKLSSEAAIVSASRGYETYSVVMKVRSPPFPAARGAARRAPVDLVTVLDVSGGMIGGKIEMLKRAMRIVISSLRETDRLSIVAFSSSSKRMSQLRRMTASGRRSARRIVDALLAASEGTVSVIDVVMKAAKVIEDRRQKNLFSSIFVLTGRHSDQAQWAHQAQTDDTLSPLVVSSTRFSALEIPVHMICLDGADACNHALPEDAFAKRVNGLLSLSVQDVSLELGLVSGSGQGEIASVYSLTGRPGWFGSSSIRFGDMYAEEEREVLVEIKAPGSFSSGRSHRVMTVRSRFVDPTSQELRNAEDQALIIPRPLAVRSSNPNIGRLRNIHVSRRAVAEARRLLERDDYAGAKRMLTSARALLEQYGLSSGDECLRGVDAELAELNRQRGGRHVACKGSEQMAQKTEPLTPLSAWKAAERLAKVAITRKHMNRVRDLHGFENARF